MYIKFIKEHPSGFQKDAGLNTSDVFGARMRVEEFAVKITKAEFEKLDSNAVIVAENIAKDKAVIVAEKKCEDCSEDDECEDCKSSK